MVYLLYVAITAILLQTQEVPTLLSQEGSIAQHPDKVFNTDVSYYGNTLKLQAIQELQPEIVVYGNSWVNQFRAGMFAPHGFYNCSNQGPKLTAARSFLIAAKELNPNLQVAIIMLHPWQFRKDVYEGSVNADVDINRPSLPIDRYVDRLARKDIPKLLMTLDTSKTLGIRAIPQTRLSLIHI